MRREPVPGRTMLAQHRNRHPAGDETNAGNHHTEAPSAPYIWMDVALNDCHHPRHMRLGPWIAIATANKNMAAAPWDLAVTLAAILILTPIQVTKRSTFVKGQCSFRGSAVVNGNPVL
jgi:hypothetical protein